MKRELKKLDQRVLSALDSEGVLMTNEVGTHVGAKSRPVRNSLKRLCKLGHVGREKINTGFREEWAWMKLK